MEPSIFDDNEKLIWFILHRDFSTLSNQKRWKDELFQLGRIAIWKADKSFNPDKGATWAGYVRVIFHNEVIMILRKEKRWRQVRTSLNTLIGEDITIGDTIEDLTATVNIERVAERDFIPQAFQKLWPVLNKTERRVLMEVLCDPYLPDRVYGERLNMPQKTVTGNRRTIRRKWQKISEE